MSYMYGQVLRWKILYVQWDLLYGSPSNHNFSVSQLNTYLYQSKNQFVHKSCHLHVHTATHAHGIVHSMYSKFKSAWQVAWNKLYEYKIYINKYENITIHGFRMKYSNITLQYWHRWSTYAHCVAKSAVGWSRFTWYMLLPYILKLVWIMNLGSYYNYSDCDDMLWPDLISCNECEKYKIPYLRECTRWQESSHIGGLIVFVCDVFSLVLVLRQLGIPVILFYESEVLFGESIEQYAGGEYSSLRYHIILTYAQNNMLS